MLLKILLGCYFFIIICCTLSNLSWLHF